MKKRVLSLLMAVLLLVALAVPASATETSDLEELASKISGTYVQAFDATGQEARVYTVGLQDEIATDVYYVEIEVKGLNVHVYFETFDAYNRPVIVDEETTIFEYFPDSKSFLTRGMEWLSLEMRDDGMLTANICHVNIEDDVHTSTIWVSNLIVRPEVKEPSGPQDYNANIMGYGTSNTGEYMVNIVGNIQGTFDEGLNVLSYADVQAQNLSINTFNLTNGASRVMGISTVESVIVTVANGVVTNVEVKGRAQTNPGNFDRYTVNCNAF